MPSNENDIEEAILEHLRASIPQDVHEQAIPDSKTVIRNQAGDVDPYVAIQFGDTQEGRARSFAGPRGDDYILPIYIQAIAGDPRIARRVANKVRDVILGVDFSWTGNIRKRAGGGMFPIVSSNAATEAYVFPASFGLTIQYANT